MSRNPIPLSLTEPIRFARPLDMNDARDAARECAEARHQAREWKQRAMADEAEKERIYRKARAKAWATAKGASAKEREDWVNDETVDERYERDIAQRIVKAADERLAEIDAERASLHKLIEASMPTIHSDQQREPSGEPQTFGGRRAA